MVLLGVVFDCDGVLCQTKRGDEYYYNFIRSKVDLPPITAEELAYVHVVTAEEALKATTPPEKLEAIRAVVAENDYTEIVRNFLKSDPAVPQVLSFLKEKGCKLGVLSNGTRHGVRSLLEHAQILSYFDAVLTCENVAPKPDPEGLYYLSKQWGISLEEMAFVGDGMTDYGAAKMTPIHFIAFDNPKIPSDLHKATFAELLPYFQALLK